MSSGHMKAPEDNAWQRKVNAWRWQKPVQATIVFAIFSSLGALFNCCLFLSGSDLRFNPVFWLLALPAMCWYGPLQRMKRWTIVSLPIALIAFPVLSAAAWAYGCTHKASATSHHLATPAALASGCVFSVLMAFATLVALRRSSLPFGSYRVIPQDAEYRPKNILPPPDGALLALKIPLVLSLFSWLFVGIVSPTAMLTAVPNLDRLLEKTLWPMLALIPVVVGSQVWGAYQSRRDPSRPAFGFGLALLAEVLSCAGLMVQLCIEFHSKHQPFGKAALLVFLGVGTNICAAGYAWRRVRDRSMQLRSSGSVLHL